VKKQAESQFLRWPGASGGDDTLVADWLSLNSEKWPKAKVSVSAEKRARRHGGACDVAGGAETAPAGHLRPRRRGA